MTRTITGAARLAGLIGWPVAHSRSPAIHTAWIARLGLDAAYVPMAVPPDRLGDAVAGLRALGFQGVNVTIPHKQAVMPLCAHLSPAAAAIGAVKSLVRRGDGFEGHNTDSAGFRASLDREAPGWPRAAALVLGAGGAGLACTFALIEAGVPDITVTNRDPARAEAICRHLARPGLRLTPLPWEQRAAALADAALVVNATSLGMTGKPPLDLALEGLAPGAVVADVVYAPLATPLVAAARARGHRAVGGLGMLIEQARAAFAFWFGMEPDDPPGLRESLEQALEAR